MATKIDTAASPVILAIAPDLSPSSSLEKAKIPAAIVNILAHNSQVSYSASNTTGAIEKPLFGGMARFLFPIANADLPETVEQIQHFVQNSNQSKIVPTKGADLNPEVLDRIRTLSLT